MLEPLSMCLISRQEKWYLFKMQQTKEYSVLAQDLTGGVNSAEAVSLYYATAPPTGQAPGDLEQTCRASLCPLEASSLPSTVDLLCGKLLR